MIPIKIKNLKTIITAQQSPSESAGISSITGVSIDTRTIKPGDCFFAIKGENFDGQNFTQIAAEKGAACIVSQQPIAAGTPNIIVPDPIKALGQLSRWYRQQLTAKVVAITGSAGKTTTRQLTHQILSTKFDCLQSPKSFNNNIGLPLTLLSAQPHHEIIIAELGSNAPGEIEQLTMIARPDIAVVTNVYPAHLEGFGSIENIIIEKTSIHKGLSENGTLLINGNLEHLAAHCKNLTCNKETFGTTETCDITAANLNSTGLTGQLTIENKTINIPLAGTANLENTLAAWAICKHLGMNIDEFATAAATLENISMRLHPQTVGPVTIINDCYNANPASMRNALDCLTRIGSQNKQKRLVLIAGTMAELGEHSEPLHAQLGRDIAAANIHLLIAAGKYMDTTIQTAHNIASDTLKTALFKNTNDLCNKLQDFLQPDDIILVKASRSAKLESAVNKIKDIFATE